MKEPLAKPVEVAAEAGSVIVDDGGDFTGTMTPQAALESAQRLRRAAEEAGADSAD